jgi:glycerol uptake facilitator-like aquaporin
MEVHNGDKFMSSVLLVEFLGILCYEICNNLYDGHNQPALVYMCFMMICLRISGGHLNPAVTTGVYMEQLEFKKNAGFAVALIIVQFLGAFCGLCITFMLRVSIPSEDQEGKYIFIPDQYPFYPHILDGSNGLPAYGQVFLAETIGTMFFVMLYLTGKYEVARGRDPFAMIVCVIIGWIGLYTCLEHVSGGIFNPAIALA